MITSHRVWPRTATLSFLAGPALVAGLVQLLRPEWNGRTGPAVLAVATVAVAVPVLRHSRRIDLSPPRRGAAFAAIAGLLALGHVLRALGDLGVNRSAAGRPVDMAELTEVLAGFDPRVFDVVSAPEMDIAVH